MWPQLRDASMPDSRHQNGWGFRGRFFAGGAGGFRCRLPRRNHARRSLRHLLLHRHVLRRCSRRPRDTASCPFMRALPLSSRGRWSLMRSMSYWRRAQAQSIEPAHSTFLRWKGFSFLRMASGKRLCGLQLFAALAFSLLLNPGRFNV